MQSESLKEQIRKQEILCVLEEGVLFINDKLEITDEYSTSLEKIIDQDVKFGQPFISLFKNRVPENIVNNIVEYMNLMFKDDLDEETVTELNPLNVVEFHFENRWGLWTSSKYLRFRFNRLVREKKIDGLITTVTDITSQISLSKKLEEVEKDTNKQMEWLVNMLHVEPPLLKEFLDVSEFEMLAIDKELKNTKEKTQYDQTFNKLLRFIHQLMSNASLLNLNFFIFKLKQFESDVKKINEKKDISSGDFVPIVIQLGEVRQMLQDVKVLMNKFKHFTGSIRPKRQFEDGLIIRALANLVENLSADLGKEVKFTYTLFNSSAIPYSYQQVVREFLIILVRFSILYCFEKPDERRSANKSPVGSLEIETYATSRVFGFKLRHDGRLIRIERLLQKSIENTENEIQEDKNAVRDQLGTEVIKLLFMPTTATSSLSEAEYSQEVFNDMEVAKKKLKMHRGKIKIIFTSENYCEYTISLPVN
jgi:hypothetical protein